MHAEKTIKTAAGGQGEDERMATHEVSASTAASASTASTVWFVSRHPGAVQWMQARGPQFDRHVTHLDPAEVGPGDTVIGTLPVNLAAEVCARGARYFNLSLQLGANDRGRELSADELERYQAQLQEFFIQRRP